MAIFQQLFLKPISAEAFVLSKIQEAGVCQLYGEKYGENHSLNIQMNVQLYIFLSACCENTNIALPSTPLQERNLLIMQLNIWLKMMELNKSEYNSVSNNV